MATALSDIELDVASRDLADVSASSAGREVLVVGAGLGGLAAAVRLAAKGYRVRVLERHATPGGRCGLWESEGFQFDTGPTLLLMTDYLRKVFDDAGRRLEDYLDLRQLDPNYRVYYADGTSLEVTSRINRMLEGVERIEPGVGPRFLRFLAETAKLYAIGLAAFVDRNVHRRRDFFNVKNGLLLLRARAMERLQKMVGRYFKDERLQQAFSFQSLYLGLSPYESPAIYSLLPYTEVAGGLYFPMGGMHAIPRALARLAGNSGVDIEYGVEVSAPGARRRRGSPRCAPADGRRLDADIVLVNADLPYAYESLLGERYEGIDRFDFSCSVFLMYLGVDGAYPDLPHHNLVVPADLRRACDDIFERHQVPADPAFYICNPSKTDPSLAPEGMENIYVLVPVPSQDPARPIDWASRAPGSRPRCWSGWSGSGSTDLRRRLVTKRTFTPADFQVQLSATRGEAFGLSHDIEQIGYFRPHNRHADCTNLFFVGQSTHPGCGVPMVLISSRVVVERIVAEQGAVA